MLRSTLVPRLKLSLTVLSAMGCLAALPAAAAPPQYGKLSGVVMDLAGTPQMGATVVVLPENRPAAETSLLTNDRGVFSAEKLLPGLYSVRVTLAGFLPALHRHVRVDAALPTLLRIELDSLFTAVDRLRRRPAQPMDSDEWAWVLRTSSATRPILRYVDGEVRDAYQPAPSEKARKNASHGRVELTSGARRPGSASNLADAPSSAFSYSQKIGSVSRLMLAGQMSYENSAAAGFATMWLPAGETGKGPETTLVLRQSKLGPGGPTFRGVRMQQTQQHTLGDRIAVRYGAEYILVGLGRNASTLRPRGEVNVDLGSGWRAMLLLAASPRLTDEGPRQGALQAALDQLDAFPAVLLRNGRPVFEGGWHEEMGLERKLGETAIVVAALFHDRSRHTAVFGRGDVSSPEFFQDYFSDAFAYDGGASRSWGTRIAYRQKFPGDLEATLLYAWAGVLAPDQAAEGIELRDALQTRYRHSLAARVSARMPRWGTQLSASYKWINGQAVSRQDNFGEISYQVDPYFNLSVRQPLPEFLFFSRKFEALADFRNLLAQGYVPVSTAEGQLLLIPSMRTVRGGLNFQF